MSSRGAVETVFGYRADVDSVLLRRLAAHRGVAVPDQERLPEFADNLGWRLADMLAIAGLPIPADLMPADPTAKRQVQHVLQGTCRLTAKEIGPIRQYARALAPSPNPRQQAAPPATVTFGAVLERFMLVRNLDDTSVCNVIAWSEALLRRLILGYVPPKPVWLLYLGDVLDLRPDDLAALSAVPTPSGNEPTPDYRSHVGGLVWDLTPLSADAIEQVASFVVDMRHDPAGNW
ncbi:hypothetical protein ACQEVZ_44880 [Dactylosporangium sp. CA-152071]|uniref:hypothetical protein n=1 Tax=Dactylosporangium sp. CA-152071 TaxID=3239933 RepID=UPI003D8AD4F9